MGGSSTPSKNVLNKTLSFIVKLLNKNNVKNWFIGYGTLLGIVRDDSCIDGDDDVDIIVDKCNYNIIANLLKKKKKSHFGLVLRLVLKITFLRQCTTRTIVLLIFIWQIMMKKVIFTTLGKM